MTIAVIFVPPAHVATYASQCLAYCSAKAYEVAGIATDWPSAIATIAAHAAGVIVVARPDHLAPDREPRVEVVDQQASHAVPPNNAGPVPRRRRRPNQV